MHFSYFLSLSSVAICVTASRITLSQRQSPASLHRRNGAAIGNINIDAGFWFSEFAVGNSTNLTMLIDTGSGDVIVNPGLYAPGKTSKSLHAEFSNNYGTTSSNGTGTGNITGNLFTDQVSFGSLTTNQIVGSGTNANFTLPNDGVVGFSGQRFVQFPDNSTTFFQSLCNEKLVDECRFALALTANGTGTQVLGELDTSLYEGALAVTPSLLGTWAIAADLHIGNKVVETNMILELDSGTSPINGPIDVVSKIFNATGIQGITTSTPDGPVLTGYFPCDKPPTSVGFGIPSLANASTAAADSSSPVSHTSSIFNIPSWIAADNGNNNCTAILAGVDVVGFEGLWVIGQAFFQGLYVDHNLENQTMGFAPLKSDNSTGTTINPSNMTTTSPSSTSSTKSSGNKSRHVSSLISLAVIAIIGVCM